MLILQKHRVKCATGLLPPKLTLTASHSVQFSRSVVSDSLRLHESQHSRLPCPSPTPRVHSDSRPLRQWCYPAISSSVVPFSCPQSLPASESSSESALCMRWPRYWSFSFSIIPSREIPGLISFKMDWLDLLTFIREHLLLAGFHIFFLESCKHLSYFWMFLDYQNIWWMSTM